MQFDTDHAFNGGSTLRRVRVKDNGIVRLDIDTEEHDLDLLYSIAEAVRADESVPGLLRQYAEVQNRLNEIELGADNDNLALKEQHALEDELHDLRVQIDYAIEYRHPGEGTAATFDPEVSEVMAGAMVRSVALSELAEEPRLAAVGGDAA